MRSSSCIFPLFGVKTPYFLCLLTFLGCMQLNKGRLQFVLCVFSLIESKIFPSLFLLFQRDVQLSFFDAGPSPYFPFFLSIPCYYLSIHDVRLLLLPSLFLILYTFPLLGTQYNHGIYKYYRFDLPVCNLLSVFVIFYCLSM